MAKDITKNSSEARRKNNQVEKKLTSQHLAGRLDNAKDKRIAFFMMHNPRHQARHLVIKNGYSLRQTTSFASFVHSHLCLAFGQSQARLYVRKNSKSTLCIGCIGEESTES
jgi:hypothetical protein